MVKMKCLVLTFLIYCSQLAAAEFIGSVNRTQVALGESFFLHLTLKDASAKGSPSLASLKKDFTIQSQQHANNTSIYNGKVSSSISWKISLVAKTEGTLQIPPIVIDTNEGFFATQPITLNVVREASKETDSLGPQVITTSSNASPYKNEPFIFTVLLTSKSPLYNIQSEKLQVDDSIVELLEEPKLKEKVIDGVLQNVVEYSYLITPLKSGPLKIPSIAIQGAIPQKRKGAFHNFFDDDFDPFAMMQGFERLKPFTLATDELPLTIMPPMSEVSPWITAKALTITEEWPKNQTLRVGEPLTRTLIVKGEGLTKTQLPHITNEATQIPHFKVYADKPEETQTFINNTLFSERKEQYTLIPQQAGSQVLPEISISWWDSSKKIKQVATISSRTVEIEPAFEKSAPMEPLKVPQKRQEESTPSSSRPITLYVIIALLASLLIASVVWGIMLQRKISSGVKEQKPKNFNKTAVKPKQEKLPDLNPT